MPQQSSAFISPMLATPARSAWSSLNEDEWAFEMKWDGYRIQVHVDGGQVRLLSRRGNDLTPSFPELAPEVAKAVQVDRAILDGELVVLGADGTPDFGRLQKRAGVLNRERLARVTADRPAHLMVFDVLAFDDVDATSSPYEERRAALTELVEEQAHVHVPPAFIGDIDSALASSAEWGLEGVVAKRRTSLYSPGKRSPSWVKMKLNMETVAVVLGWRPSERRGVEGLAIGVREEGIVRYAGTLTGGWSMVEARELAARLRAVESKQDASGEWRWTRPEVEVDVEFAEWTSGGRMRHPMWRGMAGGSDAAP